jgi:mono/diheme cytochrome c family protein
MFSTSSNARQDARPETDMNFRRKTYPEGAISAQARIHGFATGFRAHRPGPVMTLLAGLLAGAALVAAVPAAGAAAADQLEIGRRIYEEGILSSGAPLAGERFDAKEPVTGSRAACVTCHRPSGMGSVEGDLLVQPVTGTYLFNLSLKARAVMDPHVGKGMNLFHEPYTDETLATAIRTGTNNGDRTMNVAMPHYPLPEADMKALVTYLKQLSANWSPGVTADRIRFATVVTPDIEPQRRKVFLDMMRTAFVQKNGSTQQGRRHMVSPAEMLLRTERKWDLDVWELQGAPETWAAQLDTYYRKQPVFAIASGLAGTNWEQVHDFCERQRVPCWFPSVDLPPAAAEGHGQGFYSVYFTRGVALEADLLAQYLRNGSRHPPKRLIQVVPDDFVGHGAAKAMALAMEGSGIAVEERVLRDHSAAALTAAWRGIGSGDALMLWLRPDDVAALAAVPPPAAAGIYFSAGLANGEHGFPAAWKPVARLVYPYELPAKRQLNQAYFHAWLKSRNIPVIDEAMQSEVYFALTYLTDSLADMLDNVYRDYLLERAENMIGRREASRAEEEARDRPNLGFRGPYAGNRPAGTTLPEPPVGPVAAERTVGNSQSTTIYPRLALGPGQRFASKGGYIVHFANGDSDALVSESDWIVP